MTKREIEPDRLAERSGRMAAAARTRQDKGTMRARSVESELPIKKSEDIKVFISHRDSKCDECGEELGRKAWITLEENKGALCLACADLDELVFLPSGDAALTRRARNRISKERCYGQLSQFSFGKGLRNILRLDSRLDLCRTYFARARLRVREVE